ncbi:hypothetical protein ZWY2020_008108 [Hordeum vulgare]|nr:hypothetical protein ZWY2020_008108 [Hordeum vulgare]
MARPGRNGPSQLGRGSSLRRPLVTSSRKGHGRWLFALRPWGFQPAREVPEILLRNLPTPPPPPLDPDRDPRLPLPGSPGDIRHREAVRSSISDVDREAALRAELVARPPPVSRPRDEPASRAPPARAPARRPSASTWMRDRQDHRRDEWRGAPHSRRGDEDRRFDWRSSHAEGADWRRDAGPSRRVSPEAPPAAPMPVPGPAEKKKKSKKKKAVAAIPGGAGCPTPPGAPEQEALDPPARASRQRSRQDTMCINCGCAGHFCSDFYFVDAEIEEEEARPYLATVTLAPDQATPVGLLITADLIQAELVAYIGDFRDSDFAWEVTEISPLVFSVPFPSAELLRVCSHDLIRCPLNKFMISIQAAAAEPDPVPPLEKVWVLVYGLPRGGCAAPRGGKLTHILKAISEPVGKLITADLASFEDDGPARIEILCPAPPEIDGLSLVFYFGTKGRRLTFELESPAPVDPLGPAEAVPEPGDGGLDDEGGSSKDGSSSEGDDDDGVASPAPSDGRRNPDSLAARPPGLAGDPPFVALVPVTAVETGSSPPGAAVPAVVAEEEVSVGMEVCPASSPRSHGVVCYSRSPVSPPSPTLGSPATGLLPAVDLGWVSETPPASRSRPREGASPVVARRRRISDPNPRDGASGDSGGSPASLPVICFRVRPPLSLLLPLALVSLRLLAIWCPFWRMWLWIVVLYSGGRKSPLLSRSPPCVRKRGLRGRWRKPVASLLRQTPLLPRCTPDLVIERLGMVVHPR